MQRSTRRLAGRRRLFACVIATAAVLLAPGTARADCADEIIDEVINTGQVAGDYDLGCYDQALARLNPDVEEYGEAPSIIRTAKVAQRDRDRQQAGVTAPADGEGGGGDGEAPAESPDDGAPADDGAAPQEGEGASSEGAAEDDLSGDGLDEADTDVAEPASSAGTDTVAAAAFEDDDGLAVGPLLLGGIAVGLIAVGGGGMVYRKLSER